VARADLPDMTQAMAAAFVAKAVEILRGRGWHCDF
jgi:hypothetical protein